MYEITHKLYDSRETHGKGYLQYLFATCFMLAVFFVSGIQVNAASNTMDTATPCALGQTISNSFTNTSSLDTHFYKITLPESGRLNFSMNTDGIKETVVEFYTSQSDKSWSRSIKYDSTSKKGGYSRYQDLVAGDYYFLVKECRYSSRSDDYYTGTYSFTFTFEPANETFGESQTVTYNELALARPVAVDGTTYNGQLADNDLIDYYTFSLPSSGRLTINHVIYCERQNLIVYDSDGEEVWSFDSNWNDTSHMGTTVESKELASGTYYLVVKRVSWYSSTGKYNVHFQYEPVVETYPEGKGGVNNTIATASPLQFNQTVSGHLAINDDCDYYRLEVPSKRNLNIQLVSSDMKCVRVTVFDVNGSEVYTKKEYRNFQTGMISLNNSEAAVSAGTYYVYVGPEPYEYSKGSYTLTVGTYAPVTAISLNTTKVTLKKGEKFNLVATVAPADATNPACEWSSNNNTVVKVSGGIVTALKAGVATITVTSKESDKITATCKVIVVPSAPKLKKVKRSKSSYSSSRYLNATYKTDTSVDGCQIVICKNKKFKKGCKRTNVISTNFSTTKVKKGTYYVKVRAFIKVDGKRIFGPYSNVKKIKIK